MSETAYFMVFAAGNRQAPGQVHYGPAISAPVELVWDLGPIGVFKAPRDAPELACHAAARKHGHAGTYFAIEGTPYGLAVSVPEGVSELGFDEIAAAPQIGAGE